MPYSIEVKILCFGKKVEGFLEVYHYLELPAWFCYHREVVSSIGGRKSLMILSHFFPAVLFMVRATGGGLVWSNLIMKGGFKVPRWFLPFTKIVSEG